MFEGSTCLITGGTGSWGYALTRRLLAEKPLCIRILSRNEYAQVKMQRHFRQYTNLEFMIGDVRDEDTVWKACQGVDYVFHLAALKHVPICEQQPDEAFKTNVLGTQNIIRASADLGVKKVVAASTDKAVDPTNFYGITKALGEKLMIQANETDTCTRFVCVRGGNVLGTSGSVVPLFARQIREEQRVTLTDKNMSRFFMTMSDAMDLLLHASKDSLGGETFVMKTKPCRIADLANVLVKHLATTPVSIEEVGIRPGEKLNEVLVSKDESQSTHLFDENYFVILPHFGQMSAVHAEAYKCLPKVPFEEYSSTEQWMTEEEIEALLRRGGVLQGEVRS